MSRPLFNNFFSLLRIFSYSVGLPIFESQILWSKSDRLIMFCGCFQFIWMLRDFFSCFYAIYKQVMAENYVLVISLVPSALWGAEACLNYLVIIFSRNRIVDLIDKFKVVYDTTNTDEEENRSSIKDLLKNKGRVLRFFKFFILNNVVFSIVPLLATLVSYFTSENFEPVYLSNINWYPFDRVRYYWLNYLTEFLTARASLLAILFPDVIIGMFITQLLYHFECLGNSIYFMVQNKDQGTEVEYRKSINEAIQQHQNLLE